MKTLLLFTALIAGSVAADEVRYIPVEQVRAGMQGYGETVFEGTKRERFTFQVRSVVPGSRGGTTRIIVGLTGCPDCSEGGKHMFEHTQIYGGMSGSDMYVVKPETNEAFALGGLVAAPDFATTAKTLVTPIEYQFGMAAKLPALERPVRSPAEPGDYSGICLVYGDSRDSDWCFYGTITARREGRLFLMAHAVAYDSQNMLPFGDAALPVFLMPVADILQSQQSPTKVSGERIAPIGSAVVHGPYGFVVDEGALPKTVPVTLTVNDVLPKPVSLTYHMAYHQFAPFALTDLLIPVVANLPGDPEGSRTEVTVRLTKPEGVVHFVDSFKTAVPALRSLLRSLIAQEKKELVIESVEINYAPVAKQDYWQPVKITLDHADGKDLLSVFARRNRDNQTEQMTVEVDARPFAEYRQKKFLFKEVRKERELVWFDGATFQSYILERVPVREALKLLAQIEDREALYLLYGEEDEDLKAADTAAGRKQRLPDIRMLVKPDLPNVHFYLPHDKDGITHAVKFENR